MSCETWRDAISALADGEEPPIDARMVNAHVGRCAECRTFRDQVTMFAGRPTATVVPAMPGLSADVIRAARVADRLSVSRVLRLGLVVVAVQIVLFAAPALLWGEESDTGAHAARHLGSFAMAYAIGLLVVATRPAKARGMLPVAAALAASLVVTAVWDVARGESPIIGEVSHLPELVGFVLVWLLARPPRVAGGGEEPAQPTSNSPRKVTSSNSP